MSYRCSPRRLLCAYNVCVCVCSIAIRSSSVLSTFSPPVCPSVCLFVWIRRTRKTINNSSPSNKAGRTRGRRQADCSAPGRATTTPLVAAVDRPQYAADGGVGQSRGCDGPIVYSPGCTTHKTFAQRGNGHYSSIQSNRGLYKSQKWNLFDLRDDVIVLCARGWRRRI